MVLGSQAALEAKNTPASAGDIRNCGSNPGGRRSPGGGHGSILKSRDITLPTKVRLVKAMVFPIVMYGCESWTIKRRLNTEELMHDS